MISRTIVLRTVVLTVAALLAAIAVAQDAKTNLDERFSDQEKRQHEDAAFAQLKQVFFLDRRWSWPGTGRSTRSRLPRISSSRSKASALTP